MPATKPPPGSPSTDTPEIDDETGRVATEVERRNRAFWDSDADDYQAVHGAHLRETALAWGAWRIPESQLRVLGNVEGRDVLELGCGAAQWSIALSLLGARAVGLDQSAAQLAHARRNAARDGVAIPLVLGGATSVPLRAASFDVIFCDHGAMSFCDPAITVAEAARLLRPGGLLAFCATSPLVYWTYDERRDRNTRTLQNRAFRQGPWESDDGTTDYAPQTGEWIRLFHLNGLVPEDLIELRAPKGATSTYDFIPYKWARSWPAEQIWKVRSAGASPI